MHLFDSLEERRLLSAVLDDAGVLTVTGTAKNDQIVVSLSFDGSTITVIESAGSRFKKSTPTKTTFAVADVKSLVIDALAGNDNVMLKGARDVPFEIPALINGGDGNDKLSGGAGNDTINGGDGDDDLIGAAGDDQLNGYAGDDLIVGGAGADALDGGEGDDLLNARDGDFLDTVDGGPDSAAEGEDDADIALIDAGDDATDAVVNATISDEKTGPGIGQPPPPGCGHGHGHGPGQGKGGQGDSSRQTGTTARSKAVVKTTLRRH